MSSASARPLKRSKKTGKSKPVTAFLQKLCKIVNTSSPVCKWNDAGDTIVISSPKEMSEKVLSKYFKSANFHSFVRQLHFYGFRKTDKDKTSWEFRHQFFQRGRDDLLTKIARRTSSDDNSNISVSNVETLSARINELEKCVAVQNHAMSLAFQVLHKVIRESGTGVVLGPEINHLIRQYNVSMQKAVSAAAPVTVATIGRAAVHHAGGDSAAKSAQSWSSTNGLVKLKDSISNLVKAPSRLSANGGNSNVDDIIDQAVESMVDGRDRSAPVGDSKQPESSSDSRGRKRKTSSSEKKMVPAGEVRYFLKTILSGALGNDSSGGNFSYQRQHHSPPAGMQTQNSESRMMPSTSFSGIPDMSWSGGMSGQLSAMLSGGLNRLGNQYSMGVSQISEDLLDVVDKDRNEMMVAGV